MPANIDIVMEQHGRTRLCRVSGEIDLATAPDLEAALEFGENDMLVLDLAGVGFIDSTGLRALIAAHEDAEAAGKKFRIVAGDKVNRLLALTGLDSRLDVFDSRTAAGVDD